MVCVILRASKWSNSYKSIMLYKTMAIHQLGAHFMTLIQGHYPWSPALICEHGQKNREHIVYYYHSRKVQLFPSVCLSNLSQINLLLLSFIWYQIWGSCSDLWERPEKLWYKKEQNYDSSTNSWGTENYIQARRNQEMWLLVHTLPYPFSKLFEKYSHNNVYFSHRWSSKLITLVLFCGNIFILLL